MIFNESVQLPTFLPKLFTHFYLLPNIYIYIPHATTLNSSQPKPKPSNNRLRVTRPVVLVAIESSDTFCLLLGDL